MPLDHENVRILLVDENPARMALVSQALSLNGYDQVHTAEPSDDLLALVRRIEPGLILVDVDAPSRDTLEQIALVHRHMPRPVVLFTMDRDRAMIAQAIRAGVSAYVVDGLNVARVKPIIPCWAKLIAVPRLRRRSSKGTSSGATRPLSRKSPSSSR